jgi:hypothetical protein
MVPEQRDRPPRRVADVRLRKTSDRGWPPVDILRPGTDEFREVRSS